MYEVLVIIAVVQGLYVLHWMRNRAKTNSANSKAGGKPANAGQQTETSSENNRAPRLQVDGAVKPLPGHFGFLKLFGLGNSPILDMCYLQGPLSLADLTPKVANSLSEMYGAGNAVGSDVMEFIHHNKRLTQAELLWFTLVGIPGNGHRVVAFVDKQRTFPPPAK